MDHEETSARFTSPPTNPIAAPAAAEEVLVSDARSGLTPAQLVERKLVSLLDSTPLSVSRLQTMGTRRVLS